MAEATDGSRHHRGCIDSNGGEGAACIINHQQHWSDPRLKVFWHIGVNQTRFRAAPAPERPSLAGASADATVCKIGAHTRKCGETIATTWLERASHCNERSDLLSAMTPAAGRIVGRARFPARRSYQSVSSSSLAKNFKPKVLTQGIQARRSMGDVGALRGNFNRCVQMG